MPAKSKQEVVAAPEPDDDVSSLETQEDASDRPKGRSDSELASDDIEFINKALSELAEAKGRKKKVKKIELEKESKMGVDTAVAKAAVKKQGPGRPSKTPKEATAERTGVVKKKVVNNYYIVHRAGRKQISEAQKEALARGREQAAKNRARKAVAEVVAEPRESMRRGRKTTMASETASDTESEAPLPKKEKTKRKPASGAARKHVASKIVREPDPSDTEGSVSDATNLAASMVFGRSFR